MEDRSKLAKNILWNYIKNKRLGGYEFKVTQYVQKTESTYFYCQEAKLIVKVGAPDLETERALLHHMTSLLHLHKRGVVVFSFHPEHVICRIDKVLSKILLTLHKRARHWRETTALLN